MKHILVTCKGKRFQVARAMIARGEYEIIANTETKVGAMAIIDALNEREERRRVPPWKENKAA